MPAPSTTKALVLKSRPEGLFKESDFAVEERPVPALEDGQVVVEVAIFSLDPTHRGWAATDTYMPAVKIDSPMRCIVAGKVVASKDAELPEGSWGAGIATLSNHVVVSRAGGFSPIPTPKSRKDLEQALSVCSFVIGLTSYASIEKVMQPKKDDVVVVSGAAGAVGSLVGQLAKERGARVIGIAGGEAKVKKLKEFFGFHDAIDYKNEDVSKRLKELAPNGVNGYHDNVGGPITDAVIENMAVHGTIALCGAISEYNKKENPYGIRNYSRIIMSRLRVQGLLCGDHVSEMGKFLEMIGKLLSQDKIKYEVDLREGGIASYVKHVNSLFDGTNGGKLLLGSDTFAGLEK